MILYKCDRCEKEFNQKCNFINHKNRKFPCKILTANNRKKTANNRTQKEHNSPNSSIKQPQIHKQNIKCQYCNKLFKRKYNLKIHLDTRCRIKQQIDTEKRDIFNELLVEVQELKKSNQEIKDENQKLRKKINKLKKDNGKITYNNNGTVNNVTYNTIKLVAFGKENRRELDRADIIKSLQGYATEVQLTKLLHFNDKLPEYHNVYINNMKDKYAMVYDGEKWILKLKTNVIEDIYDTNKEYVEENINDFITSLNQSRINALKRWLDTDDSSEKIKKIKEEIKMLLYNEKNTVTKQIALEDMPTMIAV